MKRLFFTFISLVLIGCATEEELMPSGGYLNQYINYGSVSDASGNNYATVVIDNREWMAENLNSPTFANGELIQNITDEAEWGNANSAAWCYYDNDSQYEAPYGKLYNWYAINDPRNVCPVSWHVPTDEEWNSLIAFFDSGFNPYAQVINTPEQASQSEIAGAKMKSTGTQYWQNPNSDATNESGFSGLPSGYRSSSNISNFTAIGQTGNWWSSTEYTDTCCAWLRYLSYNNGDIRRNPPQKRLGVSVRCVKD